MLHLIESHYYYMDFCPLTDARIMISSCINCQYYKREVLVPPYTFPGVMEQEKLFCSRDLNDTKKESVPA